MPERTVAVSTDILKSIGGIQSTIAEGSMDVVEGIGAIVETVKFSKQGKMDVDGVEKACSKLLVRLASIVAVSRLAYDVIVELVNDSEDGGEQ